MTYMSLIEKLDPTPLAASEYPALDDFKEEVGMDELSETDIQSLNESEINRRLNSPESRFRLIAQLHNLLTSLPSISKTHEEEKTL